MVRKVGLDEKKNVRALFSRAIAHMTASGIHQWDDIYPDARTLENDIEKNDMHGFYQNNVLCGVIVLNETQLEPYEEVPWSLEDPCPLVVHRLCVHPDFQNRGIAFALMTFAERYASEHQYRSIRLDAFSGNPSALRLYQRLGYAIRGPVELRKGTFHCYEKLTGSLDMSDNALRQAESP